MASSASLEDGMADCRPGHETSFLLRAAEQAKLAKAVWSAFKI